VSVGCDPLNLALERRLSEGRTGEQEKCYYEAHYRTIADGSEEKTRGQERSCRIPEPNKVLLQFAGATSDRNTFIHLLARFT
jgi:hypothetical protein